MEVGEREIAQAMRWSQRSASEPGKAAASPASAWRSRRHRQAEEEASKFGTAEVDYIYEQPPRELLGGSAAAICHHSDLSRIARIGRRRTRGAHDGNGCGDQQCL